MDKPTIKEALEFAIEREIDAKKLYEILMQKSEDQAAGKVLSDLRDMEIKHKEMLENFNLDDFEYKKSESSYIDLKLTDYLVETEITESSTFSDILILAAKREENAFQYYSTLAAAFHKEGKISNFFNVLAGEEKKHKFHVEALYDDIVLREN